METAPLTLAHTHARNAVLETRKSNPVAASEEHDLAAGEFATAAQNSSDKEALRTLHLLEQHHKKLAQILRFQHENPPSNADTGANAQLSTESGARASPSTTDPQHLPRLSGHPRLPSRESSSIASNLASARGIPAHRASPASPTIAPQQAGAKMTDGPSKVRTSESRLRGTAQMQGMRERERERERHRTPASARQPWIPPTPSPTDITSQQYAPAEPSEPSRPRASLTEEPFQKFYSTFEGLISKISAPLAFAGLPLGTDPSSTQTSTSRKSAPDTKTDRYNAVPDRTAEPDINKLFSRAALQAIKDNTGGAGGGTGSAAESFYVVPTTGGTVSYAGILTRAEKEARRSSFEDAADEDFVDARETPPSPELRQSLSGAAAAPMGSKAAARNNNTSQSEKFSRLTQNPKTMEELQMENQALRHLSDTLSKRLHMWEVNAQSSSMALQQSLRAMHHTQNVPSLDQPHNQSQGSSPVTTTGGGGVGAGISSPPVPATDYDQRIKELEEMVRRGEKELGKVGRENDKLRDVLGRYRERWEKLKEGAKSRRAGATGTAAAGATTSAGAAGVAGATARPVSSSRRSSTQQGVADTEDGSSKAGGGETTTTTENADTSNGEREGSD
ncbi:hypothetical protein ASPNIDRAFT_213941 [Aspergillus niger ATCC 1015]|uniref:Uncharacterized protein n=1 Tax=Aspergillus niger (strain ATCC 1015 / CBS 113.46 / FGSC A1144 / LSHB Ac4 / NCTC 3858a / NRRL 328 / USDA 3528.7) TaxID=380704 RepID=G3Y4D4_ASPNA|nr:hypothetical protein ASPNIDRAFT_213941 [Aspergillus niger ATCC 1015]KAI2832686.1 hypothetical protein CBS133816_1368 [Aspergillus niger]KAI2953645.1 hypothetical protein CBS147321_489 [Aspergillus niger]KAI2960704.1 hypothetical protein CBS147322_669 [Aspergillus niger]KAI3027501.1 hypothetical protein CBS147347_4360 [Aspergillus niger]